jgi:hypothetical protein
MNVDLVSSAEALPATPAENLAPERQSGIGNRGSERLFGAAPWVIFSWVNERALSPNGCPNAKGQARRTRDVRHRTRTLSRRCPHRPCSACAVCCSFVCRSDGQNLDVAIDLINPVMESESRVDRNLDRSAKFVILMVIRVSRRKIANSPKVRK